MSVAQVEEILKQTLPNHPHNGQSEGVMLLYFTYGHYLNFAEFKQKYQGVRPLGLGFLPNWTWHVNSLGDANIRPRFIRSRAITVKGPTIFPLLGTGTFERMNSGTFGSIFVIPSEVEATLDKRYGASRVKISQGIRVVTSFPGLGPQIRMLDCIVHYDPRNTADGFKNILNRSKLDNSKWLLELASLRKAGVPDHYICEMSGRLEGRSYPAEPINLQDVEINLDKTEISPPNYFLHFCSAEKKFYRVIKPSVISNRHQEPGNSSGRGSGLGRGAQAQLRGGYSRSPTANCHAARQDKHSAPSRPVRRQEATVARPLPYTWYPQVRSQSTVPPVGFQAAPPPSYGFQYGRDHEVFATSAHRQDTSLPGDGVPQLGREPLGQDGTAG